MVKEAPVVSVDVGTSKVTVVVAQREQDGRIGILGIGTTPSRGVRKGIIIELDQAVGAINEALKQAASLAGVPIQNVYASLSGAHLKTQSSSAQMQLRSGEVRVADTNRVMEEAGDIIVSEEREVLHILSQGFSLDGNEGILEPVGLAGHVLEGQALIVTGAIRTAQNLVKALNRCGVVVKDLFATPFAAAKGVLTQEEKDLGVCQVDIGAGTTSLTIWYAGVPVHAAVLPIGGTLISADIAAALRVPLLVAEEIKLKFGAASPNVVDPTKTFTTPQLNGQSPKITSQIVLADLIEPRIQELFSMVDAELSKVAFRSSLVAGAVLTGGTSRLPGISEVGERVLGLGMRIGVPENLAGLSDLVAVPESAVAMGVIFDAIERRPSYKKSTPSIFSMSARTSGASDSGVVGRVKAVANFIGKYF
jgi:cell division protein FtsA